MLAYVAIISGFAVCPGAVFPYQQPRPPVLQKMRSSPKSRYRKQKKTLLARYKVALLDSTVHK